MKRVLFIFFSFLSFTILLNTETADAWSKKYHKELVDETSRYGKLSSSEIKLVKRCSTLADEGLYQGGRLHGSGNYVQCLELLYSCAYNLKNNVDQPLLSALDHSNKDPGYLKLYNKVYLLTEHKLMLGQEETSNTAKAAKVLGFACHLAGDIYAHRTIVPPCTDRTVFLQTWEKWCNKLEEFDHGNLINLPTLDELFGTNLMENGKGITTLKEGHTDFITLQSWYGDKKKEKTYRRYIASAFEDNPDFYKERYEKGAMELTKNMMILYGKNLPFDKEFVFKTSCTMPLQAIN